MTGPNPISTDAPLVADPLTNRVRCRYCGGVETIHDGRGLSPEQRRWLVDHEVEEARARHADCWKSKVSL